MSKARRAVAYGLVYCSWRVSGFANLLDDWAMRVDATASGEAGGFLAKVDARKRTLSHE